MHRALITGGTSGIGAAFATALARRGVDLVLVARDSQRLAATAADLEREFGVQVETMTADLTDRADQQRVVERLEQGDADPSRGGVDMLLNNAGTSLRASLTDPDVSPHDRGFEVMVRAVLVLSAAAARTMEKRGEGWIVNIGSVSALLPQNNYSAIKAWVNAYTEALHVQLKDKGVSVTLLAPGWVRTEFHSRAGVKGSSIPSFLWLSPQRLVDEALRDIAQGKSVSIPSFRFKVISVFLRIVPRRLVHWITRKTNALRNAER